jgi:hypothetical protein
MVTEREKLAQELAEGVTMAGLLVALAIINILIKRKLLQVNEVCDMIGDTRQLLTDEKMSPVTSDAADLILTTVLRGYDSP